MELNYAAPENPHSCFRPVAIRARSRKLHEFHDACNCKRLQLTPPYRVVDDTMVFRKTVSLAFSSI